MDELIKAGKFLSLILRHKPEVIGISLDEHGWANVSELIAGIMKTRNFDMNMLEEIVRTDNKQRFSFNPDHTKIRANQGHSIAVDVELKKQIPPEFLYHGTGTKSVSSILKQGLLPQSQLYVHLSKDIPTAINVGKRHGKPAVFTIRSREMSRKGYQFFLSKNGVWLTQNVPVEYLNNDIYFPENISVKAEPFETEEEVDEFLGESLKRLLDDDPDMQCQ